MIWTVDEALKYHTAAPELPLVLTQLFDPAVPVLDLGCGNAYYLWCLKELYGYTVQGVEGTEMGAFSYLPVRHADLSRPLNLGFKGNALSIEVGEHIENEDTFLDNLARVCANTLVLSWATPGQGGIGHINERPNDYVIGKLRKRGLALDVDATVLARSAPYIRTPYLKHTLMVFRR